MRIAIAGLGTETNTFNRFSIGREEFYEYAGTQILDLWNKQKAQSSICGIVDFCQQNNIELVPLYYARTLPAGPVQRDAYISMRKEICCRLAKEIQAQHIDAICLAMHGSMRVGLLEHNSGQDSYGQGAYDDPEADLMAHIHAICPELPIHLAMDMHATISDTMLFHAAAISLYKTAPHVDMLEIGRLCASIAQQSYQSARRTCIAAVRVPLILSGELSMTTQQPMQGLVEYLRHLENSPEVLSASLALGFPWADSPYLGATALVTAYEEDLLPAQKKCGILAQKLWQQRQNFRFGMAIASEAEAIALIRANQDPKPLLLSDVGDNATAGASEDTVDFLAKLIAAELPPCFFALIYDSASYETITQAGVGGRVDLELGRFFAQHNGLKLTARVLRFFTYRARNAAIVRVGHFDIAVGQQRMPVADISILDAAGIEYSNYRALIIKCGYHGEDLRAIASQNILVLSRGDTDPILERLPYQRVPRPMYPLDKDMVW